MEEEKQLTNGSPLASEPRETVKNYWVYHNITVLVASVIFAFALVKTPMFRTFFHQIGNMGYLGVLLVGIFFPSSFTVVPATAGLIVLGQELSYFWVAVAAGIGATVGDFFIFRFVRDGLAEDLEHLFSGIGDGRLVHILKSKYFGALTPVLGAIIVASPLPDELGIGFLGLSNISTGKFILMSFVLNTAGLVVLLGVLNYFSCC